MRVRAMAHGTLPFAMFILGFRWARNNVENPGCMSSPIPLPREKVLKDDDRAIMALPATSLDLPSLRETNPYRKTCTGIDHLLAHGVDHVGGREG